MFSVIRVERCYATAQQAHVCGKESRHNNRKAVFRVVRVEKL
jgi:hypothetical protein